MRLFVICIAVLVSSTAFSQSKKELQAEVDKLKSELSQSKAENAELKKPKEIQLSDSHKTASYGIGVLVGSNLKRQGGDSLDVDAMCAALVDVFQKKPLKLEEQQASTVVQEYMQKVMTNRSSKIKTESEAFLAKNKTEPGVMVTASGLQYKVIKKGTGKSPQATSSVVVHYTGKLVDGTVFDSSVQRNEPATFTVNQVISGWTEALLLMHEGDKWMLYIPSELGYGAQGAGPQIPANAALVFEVELLQVK